MCAAQSEGRAVMPESAFQRRVRLQLKRFPLHHKPTGKRYLIAYEAGGMCELHQDTTGGVLYVAAEVLKDTAIWELNEHDQ